MKLQAQLFITKLYPWFNIKLGQKNNKLAG